MVRLLCMSNAINSSYLKKVNSLAAEDKQTILDVINVRNHGIVRVAFCNDGVCSCSITTVADGMKKLYSTLGIFVDVHVFSFSFVSDDIATQTRTLDVADIFWFSGVIVVSERLRHALRQKDDETEANDLVAYVRRKVQYENMPYIGVCGGAMMASSPDTSYFKCGLDLLQGREIRYGTHADLTLSPDCFTSTEKCAFALVLRHGKVKALFFPMVKNAGRLWGFAKEFSGRLRNLAQEVAVDCRPFLSADNELFFFNLQGYFRYDGSEHWRFVYRA